MIDYAVSHGFFDDFPAYYKTSRTIPSRIRLSARYKAIIEMNRGLFAGKRVVDVASHDGRWSFAALKNGASHVVGIEARPGMVQDSRSNMKLYGVAESRYTFICGDAITELAKLPANCCDLVLCLGFLYHTIHHMQLLSQIKRTGAEYLIVDTTVSPAAEPIIQLVAEPFADERNAVPTLSEESTVLVGWPSRTGVEMMLDSLNFDFEYVDWWGLGIGNWSSIEDYRDGHRVTLLAKRRPT